MSALVSDAPANALHVVLARNDLLVVAGIPGAGKSTLLREADNRVHAVVIDSETVACRLSRVVPAWLSYRLYRPVVHCVHRWRILRAALRFPGPVIAHVPATCARTRMLLVLFGVLARRTRRLLWISVDADDAYCAQLARGRVSSSRSFARHVHHAREIERVLQARGQLRGWHSVHLLRRPPRGTRLVLAAA
ncbi:AAA family ATPase [Haloechinothrix salitolerans]|uniref:AAA family ATPase n=1 Tax=Haloechinothrix salitolerans TaxID=926830 RepID=A0ABW2C3X4_9PSEU